MSHQPNQDQMLPICCAPWQLGKNAVTCGKHHFGEPCPRLKTPAEAAGILDADPCFEFLDGLQSNPLDLWLPTDVTYYFGKIQGNHSAIVIVLKGDFPDHITTEHYFLTIFLNKLWGWGKYLLRCFFLFL